MLNRRIERRSAWILALALCCWSPASFAQKAAQPAKRSAPVDAAKALLDRGDLPAAEAELWKVLGPDAQNEQALTLLGIVRGRQERYAEAEALFKRVLELNPKSVVASRNLANALLAQDKPDEALKQYHNAIALSHGDIDLVTDVAKLELSRGDFAQALEILETIKPGRLPSKAIPLKAASLLGLGRRSEAEQLIPLAARSPAAALELAQVFIEGRTPEPALKILSLVQPSPKAVAAQLAYLKGRALRQIGDSSGAMASYRRSLAADPKSVETLMALAELYALEKKHGESLAMLEKARGLKPDSAVVLRHLVVEAMQAGQNKKGLEGAQALQKLSSEMDDRYLVASVLLQQKQYVSATHILEDYVAQRPQDAKAYLGLGMGYLNLLRYADARQALERSLQLDSNLAEAEYQMGLLTSQQGSRDEAVRHWQKAIELQPGHGQALFSLGTVYLESGDLSRAESAFSRSLAAEPWNMKAEYNLALVLNKLGRADEAKSHFERYRKMQEDEHTNSGNPKQKADSGPSR